MIWDLSELVDVRHVRDHVVYLCFDDGLAGEVDLSGYVGRGPIFQPLADESFFKQVSIQGGTLAWPNGADIAPERLYDLLQTALGATR
jgi:hypothetical protein